MEVEKRECLKWFQKKKNLAIIITILVIFNMLLGMRYIVKHNFYMDVKDVKIYYRGESIMDGNKALTYGITSNPSFLQPYCWDYDIIKDTENGIVYVKVVGVLKFDKNPSESLFNVKIYNNTKCAYLIDGKDNKIKIWDKEQGVLTQ